MDDPKDKREAAVGYGSPGLSGHSYQAPSLGQGDASAISIGAGYSIGGAKPSYSFSGQGSSGAQPTFSYGGQGSSGAQPSYSFGGQGSSGALQYSAEGLSQLSPNGHASFQLAPITLQPSHGAFATGDLSQFMNQLSHSLGAGGLSLQPSNTVAEFHQGQGAEAAQSAQGSQEYAFPQFSYAAPKQQQQQYVLSEQLQQQLSSAPAYSSSTKGLGSYSTGPVLFTPSETHSSAPAATYGGASSGHSFGDAGSLSLGGGAHSLNGLTLGGAGHSFGGSYKQLSGAYAAPGKSSFKPSAYIGSSVQGESGHGLSSLSGSYSAPSFGSYRGASHGGLSLGSAGHGVSFGGSLGGFGSGSSKFIAPAVYQSNKGEGLDGASAFSSGHVASPPGTTYGFPTSSYSANNAHAASSNKPYYVSAKHHHHATPSSFSEGSSAYRAPATSHSSLSSYSSGPKYSFGSSSSHYAPKDAHGSASETSYNTIKYSEELKPRVH